MVVGLFCFFGARFVAPGWFLLRAVARGEAGAEGERRRWPGRRGRSAIERTFGPPFLLRGGLGRAVWFLFANTGNLPNLVVSVKD